MAIALPRHVEIGIDLPHDLPRLALPEGLDRRLHSLLDKQDLGEELTPDERAEAEGLVTLSELLDLLKLRASQAAGV